MHIVFADTNHTFIDSLCEAFKENPMVFARKKDIRYESRVNTAFLCPCNGEGYIPDTFKDIFDGVELKIKRRIRVLGNTTPIGRTYLPIGAAIITDYDPIDKTFLIASPLMFSQQDISKTQNVYHAFMASLCLLRKFNIDNEIDRLVCPALGCGMGMGNMNCYEAAKQVYAAFKDFHEGNNIPIDTADYEDIDMFQSYQDYNDEQPNYYENLEIKTISSRDVIFSH